MRALILSDVHSNLEALRAVVEDAERRQGFEAIWCLGDLVGYGPSPNACLKLLWEYPLVAVAGNHDHAAIGRIDLDEFNYAAAAAARWTAAQLSESEADFLANLPLVAIAEPFTLVHGSLRAPVWEYLLDQEAAQGTLALLETRYCLVGHSHIPFICMENQGAPHFVEFVEDHIIELDVERWIINPGGVGQPRDRDPRSSYAIYDSGQGTIERHRVAYNIADLLPLLGAWGHTLILSEDQTDYVHSHPEEQIPTGAQREKLRGGPDVTFEALMPRPGTYRVWTQFLRGDAITTVTFTLKVSRLQ